MLTIRPEHVEVGVDEGPNTCVGLLRECIYVGTHTRCKIVLDGREIEATSATDSPVAPGEGREVTIRFPPDRLWLLPDEGA
jgi:hypothetical protein